MLAAVWMLLAIGCAPKASAPRQPDPAQLVVINLTDYAWSLAITAVGGGDPRREQVPPRAERTLKLAGGVYEIDQAVTSADAASNLRRRLSIRVEPGRTYRWRLATLLSGSPANPP